MASELFFFPVFKPLGAAGIALSSLAVQLLAVHVPTLSPEPFVFLLDPLQQVPVQQCCAARNAR